jgi:hypothetical protein
VVAFLSSLKGFFYWRKALLPTYYNSPHEYVVRQRDLFLWWAPWRCEQFGEYMMNLPEFGVRASAGAGARHNCSRKLFEQSEQSLFHDAAMRRRGLLRREVIFVLHEPIPAFAEHFVV